MGLREYQVIWVPCLYTKGRLIWREQLYEGQKTGIDECFVSFSKEFYECNE